MKADSLFLMNLLEEARQDRSGDPRQQPVLALQHIDLGSQFSRRGRDLEPDIATADHGQPEAGPDPGLDGLSVLDGPEFQKAVQITAGQDQPARPRARGDDQLVIGQHLIGRQGHGPCRAIEADHPRRGPQVDVRLGVPCRRSKQQAVTIDLALQPALGERGALVRRVRLLADQNDGVGIAVLTQQGGRRSPAVSRANDDRGHFASTRSSPVSAHLIRKLAPVYRWIA